MSLYRLYLRNGSEPEKQFAGRAECVFDAQKDGQIEYSKQAFSKGRKRIKPEAFQELFQSVVDSFYEKSRIG